MEKKYTMLLNSNKPKTNYKRYWLSRGKTYYQEYKDKSGWQRRYGQKCIKKLMATLKQLEFNSVLDVGCGFGLITKELHKHFPDVLIHGIDISPHQIRQANISIHPCDYKVTFTTSSFQDFTPYKTYDLVLSTSLLMHIPSRDINNVLNKMVDLSSKYIVNMDWTTTNSRMFEPHCYSHDYYTLYNYTFKIKHINTIHLPKRPTYTVSFGLDTGLKLSKTKSETHCIYIASKVKT